MKVLGGIFATIALLAIAIAGLGAWYFHSRPFYSFQGIPAPGDYVGEWRGAGRVLLIAEDGRIHYERHDRGLNIELNLPLQKLDAGEIVVGAMFWGTTFKINTPPHADGAIWRMTIDGVEYTRLGEPAPANGIIKTMVAPARERGYALLWATTRSG